MRNFVSVLLALCMVNAALAAAPTISAVSASPVNDTWAMVNWTTNIGANSYVDYGLTTSYGGTEYIAGYVTSHKVQLNNLTAATTYHYRIRTGNSSGEYYTSGDYTFATGAAVYGCESNPTGEPIGGGGGYSRTIDKNGANVTVVSTAATLKSALSAATSGKIVYVDDDAIIDLTGQTSTISIKTGVTLASGRGRNGSLGGMIVFNTFSGELNLFATGGTGTRITGLRMAGPWNGPWRTAPEYHGIYVGHNTCEIDNNEFFGWNYAALETLIHSGAVSPYYHHNYVHHNTKLGCGYGICPGFSSGNVVPIIEGNIFDYERHSVAGHGNDNMSYEARYNLVLEHSISHVFDMHGGADRDDGTTNAGAIMRIHHNTVRNTDQSAVVIRGAPTVGCWTNNNRFYHANNSLCIRQLNDYGNFWYSNNQYGVEAGTVLGQWNFGEGMGVVAYDSAGNNNDGALTGMNSSTCWVPGHTGTGLKFLDGSDYVDCGSDIYQTDNIAFDCWANFDSLPTYMELMNNGVFDLYYRGGTAGPYIWFRSRITSTTAYPGDSWWPGYAAVKSTVPIVAGEWYRYVGVRKGNTLALYTNGVLDRTLDCLAGQTVSTSYAGTLKIGQGTAGTIDDASVYILGPGTGSNPTLTWTGEANYTDCGVYPQVATATDYYTFRVKYTDADNDAPRLAYPKLHILRHGAEFEYASPLVMSAIDLTAVNLGRIYQYKIKLPRGLDYTYYFEAADSNGNPATGAATAPVSGPTVTTGNNAPVFYYTTNDARYTENIVSPYSSSGSNTQNYEFRAAYVDIDDDPPMAGYPKLKVMIGTTEIPGSPFTMAQVETSNFFNCRNYSLIRRFPQGSYKCQAIANDMQGTAATGLPLSADSHPIVNSGTTMWCDVFTGTASPNPTMSFPVNVWFGQSTSDFMQSDITVTNGGISGFTGSGAFYTFTVTATTAGSPTTVKVLAGACNGSSGANTASGTVSVTCTNTGTAPTVALFSSRGNPHTTAFDVEVTFNQPVTGFASTDIMVTNGTIGGFAGSGASYTFTVSPTVEGVVSVIVPAGVVSPSNLASSTLTRVYYPATGANNIWVGHGYPGARLGTMTDPFDSMSDAIPWLKTDGTLYVLSGSNPEHIRIDKRMRIQSYGGIARVGSSTGVPVP